MDMERIGALGFAVRMALFILIFLACAAGLLYAAKYAGLRPDLPIDGPAPESGPSRAFVIDPGHGGRDGGAVGVTGAVEKDIDLSVAKKLSALLSLCGKKTVMTRTEDEMLSLPGTTGNKKGRDIRSRIKIAEEAGDCLLVSIHANSYPIEKYKGMQVFYRPDDPESEKAAESVRLTCVQYLQPDNGRAIKQAPRSIYLLNNLSAPAILIECGFLSNAEEEELLCDDLYRVKLAAVICAGLLEAENN